MSISLIKLINGEEVLGSIVSNDSNGMLVENPLLVSIERDFKSGLSGLTLLTYIPYSEEQNVLFNNNAVISYTDVDLYMTEYYEKSLAYNRKHHDKKYKHNINYAISQLDYILNDDKPKKKESDPLNKILYTSIKGSNTNSYN